MKTVDELIDYRLPSGCDGWTRMTYQELKELVETTQQDAFECGRVAGLNEAGELCQTHEQTKTEYMARLHNLIHDNSRIVVTPTGSGYNFGAKITLEPKPATPQEK